MNCVPLVDTNDYCTIIAELHCRNYFHFYLWLGSLQNWHNAIHNNSVHLENQNILKTLDGHQSTNHIYFLFHFQHSSKMNNSVPWWISELSMELRSSLGWNRDEGSHPGVQTTGEPSLGSLALAPFTTVAHGDDCASSDTAWNLFGAAGKVSRGSFNAVMA